MDLWKVDTVEGVSNSQIVVIVTQRASYAGSKLDLASF